MKEATLYVAFFLYIEPVLTLVAVVGTAMFYRYFGRVTNRSKMTFNELIRNANHQRGYLCLGLDPDPEKLPAGLTGSDGLCRFCSEVISACSPYIVAVKPNLAFFEQFGSAGWKVLERLRGEAPVEILWVLDAKRGDIGNTAKSYARALFDGLGANAVTVNPYLGADSVTPFLTRSECGVFLLALTSNPGAKDFQYHGTPPLWKKVIESSKAWNNGNLGYVIGATREEELTEARQLAGDCPILIPGVGTQGGSLNAAVRDGLGNGKYTGLINLSRAILYASSGNDYASKAADAAKNWSMQINELIAK